MDTPDTFNIWASEFFYDYVLPGSLLLWLVLVIAVGAVVGGGLG